MKNHTFTAAQLANFASFASVIALLEVVLGEEINTSAISHSIDTGALTINPQDVEENLEHHKNNTTLCGGRVVFSLPRLFERFNLVHHHRPLSRQDVFDIHGQSVCYIVRRNDGLHAVFTG